MIDARKALDSVLGVMEDLPTAGDRMPDLPATKPRFKLGAFQKAVSKQAIVCDALSGALNRLSIPDGLVGETVLMGGWGVSVPSGLLSFYLLRKGHCWLSTPELESPLKLDAGDILVLMRGQAHELRDEPGRAVEPFQERLGLHKGASLLGVPDGALALVHGHFTISGFNPFGQALPPLLRLNYATSELLQGLDGILQLISLEQLRDASGSQAIIGHLVRILLMQTLRAHIVQSHERPGEKMQSATWLSAAMDSSIGPAIAAIHAHPEVPWTVAGLARHAHMSRSAFAERFRAITGQPPLHYLTEYRIQRAAELLRDSDLGIKRIAAIVGYESASSFSNAFKRWTGQGPLDYRKGKVRPPIVNPDLPPSL